jgi:peptidoglycan/xylan/chitin deacetylase (PgdA/CDA1 family)
VKRIISLAISIVVFVGDICQRVLQSVRSNGTQIPVVVLAYHSISKKERRAFGKQMDQLLSCTQPCRADGRLPKYSNVRCAAVTFDDGYQAILDNALPELILRKIPATVFVVPGALGAPPNWKDFSGGTDCAMSEPIMTPEQLRALPSDLVQVGSHTVNHPKLPLLEEGSAQSEVSLSRAMLEDITRRDVRVFSFPYGAFDSKSIELCRRAGYDRVFITQPQPSPSDLDDFVVPRIKANPGDWPIEFALKLRGAYRWHNRWRVRARQAPADSMVPAADHFEVTE